MSISRGSCRKSESFLRNSSFLCNYDELGPEILKDPKYNAMLNPFDILWIFGFNSTVPIINFEYEAERRIFYVANNTGIFYNTCTKNVQFLTEHKENIVSITTDSTRRWLATAGAVINIWDTSDKTLITTIPKFTTRTLDFLRIGMSPSAKFLVVVYNDQKQTIIDIWLWTYGRKTPDASYTIEITTGHVKSIEFHPNHENHILVVFQNVLFFLYWDPIKSTLRNPVVEKIRKKFGTLTDGTFVEESLECFLSTTKGYLLVSEKFEFELPGGENLPSIFNDNRPVINMLNICDGVITCLTTIDEMLVSGDSNGHIKFFDKALKLLYCFTDFNLQPIKSIDFCHQTDNVVEKSADSDLERSTSIDRDLIISTTNGIFHVLTRENSCNEIIASSGSNAVAIDVHSERSLLVAGFSNGYICLYDYEIFEKIASYEFNQKNPNSDAIITLSTVKYSSKSIHLVCGRSNGELWFLNPLNLSPIYNQPLQFTSREICKIIFSPDDQQIAYYDDTNTVFGLMYQSENWCYCGKVRSHYKDIKHILFTNELIDSSLYSIGTDRYIVEYEEFQVRPRSADLSIRNRYRIEQRDIPLYFTQHSMGSGYFLVCDNQHKYKMLSTRNLMCTSVCLGPAYGNFKNRPVTKIEFLPNSDLNYLIFMNSNYIGIQKGPIDGNPYRYVSSPGHPDEIIDFCASNDGRFVFIIGRNDASIKMMTIKITAVETLYQIGGDDLEPFYCLLDGGRNGWLFQEMQDFFYYIQILQQSEDSHLPRDISDHINIVELPDLVRTCGYYPSDFEIENLLTDIRYRDFDETGDTRNEVTFNEFVKLFINHRCPYGYNVDDLRKAFEIITDEDEDAANGVISREKFVQVLTTLGESCSKENLVKCLYTLLKHDESVVLSNYWQNQEEIPLPSFIDFHTFSNEVLGIDLDVEDGDLTTVDRTEEQSSNESL